MVTLRLGSDDWSCELHIVNSLCWCARVIILDIGRSQYFSLKITVFKIFRGTLAEKTLLQYDQHYIVMTDIVYWRTTYHDTLTS